MNLDLLRTEIGLYMEARRSKPERYAEIDAEREKHAAEIRRWNREVLLRLDEEGLYDLISPLWAMLIWGNKQYVINRLLSANGLGRLRKQLVQLIWGEAPVAERWDEFRRNIKGMGPAMMSELLCHFHPETCAIWNRRARSGLAVLGVQGLPRYDYQVTGQKYTALSVEMQTIAEELRRVGFHGADLLTVDYFIWDQLQPDAPLSQEEPPSPQAPVSTPTTGEVSEFVHNEVRDKLANIGEWLGFKAAVEIKVADGSKVDTVWEATIGNMGRVIYVFEVQTKGSIDSLILNLLKALNNPAVQGVVAVSDAQQLEKIRRHAADVGGLAGKLKFWDYEEVLRVHASLEGVNEAINGLSLVPQAFPMLK